MRRLLMMEQIVIAFVFICIMVFIGCHKRVIVQPEQSVDYSVIESTGMYISSDHIADLTFGTTAPMQYVFSENNGAEECGRFWFEDGKMYFKGNMSKSARAFITVFKQEVDDYIKSHAIYVDMPAVTKIVEKEVVKEVPRPLSKLVVIALVVGFMGGIIAWFIIKVV